MRVLQLRLPCTIPWAWGRGLKGSARGVGKGETGGAASLGHRPQENSPRPCSRRGVCPSCSSRAPSPKGEGCLVWGSAVKSAQAKPPKSPPVTERELRAQPALPEGRPGCGILQGNCWGFAVSSLAITPGGVPGARHVPGSDSRVLRGGNRSRAHRQCSPPGMGTDAFLAAAEPHPQKLSLPGAPWCLPSLPRGVAGIQELCAAEAWNMAWAGPW